MASLLPPSTAWSDLNATAINESGQIVGQGLINGKPKPADGVFAAFLGILLRYPEILGWEYQYRQSREDVMRAMYRAIKAIKPAAQVGWHVDHQPSSWDLVYRAEMSYAEMAPYSDFIKFIAYHDILGPRIRFWYLARFEKTILSELPLEAKRRSILELDSTCRGDRTTCRPIPKRSTLA